MAIERLLNLRSEEVSSTDSVVIAHPFEVYRTTIVMRRDGDILVAIRYFEAGTIAAKTPVLCSLESRWRMRTDVVHEGCFPILR